MPSEKKSSEHTSSQKKSMQNAFSSPSKEIQDPHSLFDVAPEDSDKLDQEMDEEHKPHQGGQLTDEDFGDDEVERITGGDEKISGSEIEAGEKAASQGKQTVYSED